MGFWRLPLLLLAPVLIIAVFAADGGLIGLLWNPVAFTIVVPGSVLATLVPAPGVALAHLRYSLLHLPNDTFFSLEQLEARLLSWGNTRRRQGNPGLEHILDAETDEFCRRVLQLVIDAHPPVDIRQALEHELVFRQARNQQALSLLGNLAGYLPTMGIVGAVLGLIQVLSGIHDPDILAEGIATAFVATFYGVALSNLLVLPLQQFLDHRLQLQTRFYWALMDGMDAMLHGANPAAVVDRIRVWHQ